MKSIAISGSARQNVGKRDAKQLRYEGKVPCVLYGGEEQYHFAASAADLRDLIYTPEAMFVDLDIEGKQFRASMKDIQFHPVSDQVLHVDFLQLFEDKPVKMEIPVKVTGVSPGVRSGGKLTQNFRKLKVKGLPKDMVDNIEVDISSLEVGDAIRVQDIKAGNLELLNSMENTIVKVDQSRATRSAAQAGEAE
ncbi:large subunit ribosomal protein L25 [Anseongella ginsenosidimutans]|uniref:Large ribosomal subunit protein bL25 n=1 Tax=Anseongella ginsenosidimutans TaxID=496056 RepID=A0A4R3KN60_9SPHI|nr:50S ribosomal protein L25/general stress protein Ctc [Anseongella ginsenosidimutans]QEC52481.1 50S ribosomal protein L25/general stress protein Ctc [Anseongella ginsenosidimutans]TCS85340.1 large subunit ribosomal protein L25 [Anseongella ginsenosidimutans]